MKLVKPLPDNPTMDDICKYVQMNARYYADSPKNRPYTIRYPHKYGAHSISSDDTYDLVTQLAKIYNVQDADLPRQ